MAGNTLKKTFIVVISILLIIVIGIVVGWHTIKNALTSNNPKTKAVVAGVIKKEVLKASDSLYHISYSSFHLDTDSGYALITDLAIEPDTAIYNRLLAKKKAPNSIFIFKTNKLIITGMKLGNLLHGHLLQIGSICINDPTVSITNRINGENNTTGDSASILSRMVKNIFKKIDFSKVGLVNVDRTQLNNLNIVFVNANAGIERSTAIRGLTINIDNISAGDSSRHDSASQGNTHSKIAHIRMATADKLYYIDIKDVTAAGNNISIANASLIPRLSKTAYYKAINRLNDRYHFIFNNIRMNMDLKTLLRRQQFHISSMDMGSGWAEIYTNYNWPLHQPPPRRSRYPHQQLQHLAFDVTIDTMSLHKGDIYYRIVAKKSGREAVLTMLHTQGYFANITNNDAAIKKCPYTVANLQTMIMGAGLLHAKYLFDLIGKNAPYKVSATLGQMNGKALNPIIKPLSLIEIKAGQIKQMSLNMNADEYTATGNVDFYYRGMKVNMIKRDKNNNALRTMPVLTALTDVGLPKDNPSRLGHFRKGPINITRDTRESFLGFMWRGMLDGTTTSLMGFDQKKDHPHNIVTGIAKDITGPKNGQEEKSVGKDKQREGKRKPVFKGKAREDTRVGK